MFRSTEKARNAGRKGRREDDEGRDGVGSLMGVGSLLKFWGPERPPPSKIEKPIKSHGLSIGISHQIDPTPKGREGAKDSLIVLGSLVPEGSEDSRERREDRRPKQRLESSTEGGRTAWHPLEVFAGVTR